MAARPRADSGDKDGPRRRRRPRSRLVLGLGMPAAVALAVFGLVVVRTGAVVARRVTQRIDRAFFREAYDARRVLEHLTQRAREATSRRELASLLHAEIANAFHPRLVAVYLKSREGALDLVRGPDGARATLGPTLPVVERLARHGQARVPWSP